MLRAPGEARNTASAAMSSGIVGAAERDAGFLRRCISSTVMPLCWRGSRRLALRQRGDGHAGADRVDVDVVAGQLVRGHAGQCR